MFRVIILFLVSFSLNARTFQEIYEQQHRASKTPNASEPVLSYEHAASGRPRTELEKLASILDVLEKKLQASQELSKDDILSFLKQTQHKRKFHKNLLKENPELFSNLQGVYEQLTLLAPDPSSAHLDTFMEIRIRHAMMQSLRIPAEEVFELFQKVRTVISRIPEKRHRSKVQSFPTPSEVKYKKFLLNLDTYILTARSLYEAEHFQLVIDTTQEALDLKPIWIANKQKRNQFSDLYHQTKSQLERLLKDAQAKKEAIDAQQKAEEAQKRAEEERKKLEEEQKRKEAEQKKFQEEWERFQSPELCLTSPNTETPHISTQDPQDDSLENMLKAQDQRVQQEMDEWHANADHLPLRPIATNRTPRKPIAADHLPLDHFMSRMLAKYERRIQEEMDEWYKEKAREAAKYEVSLDYYLQYEELFKHTPPRKKKR